MQNIGAFANLRILMYSYFNLSLSSSVTAENFKMLKGSGGFVGEEKGVCFL